MTVPHLPLAAPEIPASGDPDMTHGGQRPGQEDVDGSPAAAALAATAYPMTLAAAAAGVTRSRSAHGDAAHPDPDQHRSS